MRFIPALLLSLLTLLTSPPAQAEDSSIEQVIRDQIAAFKADDFPTAFGFASPGIRALFGTPERFGQMVRQGYPMVWRPRDVTFLEQSPPSGRVVQRLSLRDAQGQHHLLDYFMVQTAAGWRIDGVALVPAPDVGV